MTRLSTQPLFGCRLVRGSRLLRVIHPHEVDARGAAAYDADGIETVPGAAPIAQAGPQEGKAKTFAAAGDLAIEVVDAKTGELVGYSYLTGAAITCMAYGAQPHRFEEARFLRLTALEQLVAEANAIKDQNEEEVDALLGKMVSVLQEAKYSDYDVAYFEVVCGDRYKPAAQIIMEMWSKYHPTTEDGKPVEGIPTPDQVTCHLVGNVWRQKLKKPSLVRRKAPAHCIMHLQPKRHASDHCATPFQTNLLATVVSTRSADDSLQGEPSTSA